MEQENIVVENEAELAPAVESVEEVAGEEAPIVPKPEEVSAEVEEVA